MGSELADREPRWGSLDMNGCLFSKLHFLFITLHLMEFFPFRIAVNEFELSYFNIDFLLLIDETVFA